jgi:hypothetical protein
MTKYSEMGELKCINCKQYIDNCECDILKQHAEDNPDQYHGFNKEGRKDEPKKMIVIGTGDNNKELLAKLKAMDIEVDLVTPEEARERGLEIKEEEKFMIEAMHIPDMELMDPPDGKQKRRERRKKERNANKKKK